ncbi:hypothetical protein INR49_007581 [Caranx melampygus]|nr:hypothetical protein INR49_007581 [Caranx melampygus]
MQSTRRRVRTKQSHRHSSDNPSPPPPQSPTNPNPPRKPNPSLLWTSLNSWSNFSPRKDRAQRPLLLVKLNLTPPNLPPPPR